MRDPAGIAGGSTRGEAGAVEPVDRVALVEEGVDAGGADEAAAVRRPPAGRSRAGPAASRAPFP